MINHPNRSKRKHQAVFYAYCTRDTGEITLHRERQRGKILLASHADERVLWNAILAAGPSTAITRTGKWAADEYLAVPFMAVQKFSHEQDKVAAAFAAKIGEHLD